MCIPFQSVTPSSPPTPSFFVSGVRYYVSGNRANIWVVEGRDRDLVIDAGLGVFNVAEYLDQCGLINPPRKPVLAVATHVHFDHSGGNWKAI